MTREEAIKHLEEWVEVISIPSRKKAVNMAIEAIKAEQELIGATNEIYAKGYNAAKREIALSGEYERAYHRGKVDATKWIPVSERLPEEGVDVNVTLKDFSVTRAGFYSEGDWWLITEHGTLENYPIQYVVAWNPLPKPYKESED